MSGLRQGAWRGHSAGFARAAASQGRVLGCFWAPVWIRLPMPLGLARDWRGFQYFAELMSQRKLSLQVCTAHEAAWRTRVLVCPGVSWSVLLHVVSACFAPKAALWQRWAGGGLMAGAKPHPACLLYRPITSCCVACVVGLVRAALRVAAGPADFRCPPMHAHQRLAPLQLPVWCVVLPRTDTWSPGHRPQPRCCMSRFREA